MSSHNAADPASSHWQFVPPPPGGSFPQERTSSVHIGTVSLLVLALSALFGVLYVAREVLFPVLLAFVLALLLRPLVRNLVKAHVPRVAAAAIVVALVLTLVVLATLRLFEPASQWIRQAPQQLQQVEYKLRSLGDGFLQIQAASREVERMTDGQDDSKLKVELSREPLLTQVMLTTTRFLAGAVITVCLLLLLLAVGDDLIDSLINLHPNDDGRKHWHTVFNRMEHMISSYLLTYTMINASLGCVIGTGLWAIGMPNPLLWGVMAALLNFIPYAGLFIGTTIVSLVAVLTFDTIGQAALAPAIYLLANGIEANCVTPLLLGRSMCLSPILIFLSVILWGWMWGIAGALIAVPLLVVIKVFCDHFPPLKNVGRVLGTRSTARDSNGFFAQRSHA